jgi:glycyl-tRNA synthetase beta chain
MSELLLEVGFEEMPASWLPGIAAQAKTLAERLLAEQHLSPSSLAVTFTPRRLAIAATVAARQADREERVWGPSLKVARDASGAWSGAAQGFAKKVGASLESLESAAKDPKKPDDLALFVVKRTTGQDAAAVLPEAIAALLRGLAFPKRMSWDAWLDDGKGAFPFGRPIRWLLALLDGAVVPFTIFELVGGAKGPAIVQSGHQTIGHRFLPRGNAGVAVGVRDAKDLDATLRAQFVVLDPEARAASIAEQLKKANGGAPVANDHGLAAEWRDLVEYPTVLVGDVPAEFRSLPTEVLETVLVHHQKYVPLLSGGTVARFAALTNGDGGNADVIVRNMGRVVVARLRDGAFFWAEDRKRSLESREAELAGVTFHRDLGTYRDKSGRLASLVNAMAQDGLLPDVQEEAAAHKAARLCKVDLVTLMVREFPELQGVMGGLYLRDSGFPESVVRAVQWHYHPIAIEEGSSPADVFAGSSAPTAFAAVSLADKLDTLAGYFGIGLVPTGSSDPFGLRRAAQGVVRVLLDFWPAEPGKRPSLRRLIAQALAGFEAAGKLKRPASETAHDLQGFLLDRLRHVLLARGFRADEVDAVLAAREPDALDDPQEALLRLRALARVRAEASEDFARLAGAFKRAKNILGEQEPAAVVTQLFEHDAERGLHEAVAALSGRDGDYETRLRALAGLRAPVDRFFDDVMVMAEDPKVRANRLGLLAETVALFYRIADISRLGG